MHGGAPSSYYFTMLRPHVVALKAAVLGAAMAVCVIGMLFTHNSTRRIAIHTLLQCIFHFMEFLVTAMYNPGELDDDSFILTDSDLYVVYGVLVLETTLVHWYFPYSRWLAVGFVVALGGQAIRTIAMYTAGTSFNHYVQREQKSEHVLVTLGIYRVLRHPLYFGYFWWFVGCQIYLGNPLTGLLGAFKLSRFFARRIEYEEGFLQLFFPDYEKYKKISWVGIP